MMPPVTAGRAIRCDVLAHASVGVDAGGLKALRRSPGTLDGAVFPAGRFKNADEQTVVGLASVLRAIEEGGLDPAGFGEWAVVVAPRFLGRSTFEAIFPQFLAEGAWGVSVHLVPNHSLHAVSGTISQTLKAHGPNLGVGGAPGGEMDAFLAAATMLDDGSAPGAWVVLTGRDLTHDDPSKDGYQALALALAATRPERVGVRLSVRPGSLVVDPPPAGDAAQEGATQWRVDRGAAGGPGRLPRARPVAETSGRAEADGGRT